MLKIPRQTVPNICCKMSHTSCFNVKPSSLGVHISNVRGACVLALTLEIFTPEYEVFTLKHEV